MNHQIRHEIFKIDKCPTDKSYNTPIKSKKEKLHRSITALNLIFCVCKLALIFFVIYPSKNTSLKMATIGVRNMSEANDVYIVINSHIFICNCWFYSHNYRRTNYEILMFFSFYAIFTDPNSGPCQMWSQNSTARNNCSYISYKNLQHLDIGDSWRRI